MIILFRDGFGPYECVPYHYGFYTDIGRPITLISLMEYANYLGIEDVLRSTLCLSGWSRSDIQDLCDEYFYAGFTQPIDGAVSYKTQSEL